MREGGKEGNEELLACGFCVDVRRGPAHASRADDKLLLYLFKGRSWKDLSEIEKQRHA